MEFSSLHSVQGIRSNGTIYYDKNCFLYQKNKGNGDRYYFSCKNKFCPARFTCRLGGREVLTVKHNHDPEPSKVEELKFKEKLRRRAATGSEPLSSIYVEEEALNREGALISGQYSSVRMMMHRARLRTMPPIPKSLIDMHEILTRESYVRFTTELGPQHRKFYSGIIETPNKNKVEHVLYFTSPTVQQFALGLDELTIQMDGTFAVVPKIGKTQQLYCIHIFYDNHIYPLVYALMENRSQASYRKLLELLRDQIIPRKFVSKIMTDFEKALRSAAREVFPRATFYGCWFHFATAVRKRVMREGLGKKNQSDDIKDSCRMAMALALLPKSLLNEGIDVVEKRMINAVGGDRNLETKINRFCRYLCRWKREDISLWKVSNLRTNSAVEAFHRSLMLFVGRSHPNVWLFVKFIQLIENTNACSLKRVQQGQSRPFQRKKKMVRVAEVIEKESERLLQEENVELFLLRISYAMKGIIEDHPQTLEEAESETDDDEITPDQHLRRNSESQSINDTKNMSLCIQCCNREPSYAYIPCGHRNTCEACAEVLHTRQNFECPTCKSVAQGIFRIQ